MQRLLTTNREGKQQTLDPCQAAKSSNTIVVAGKSPSSVKFSIKGVAGLRPGVKHPGGEKKIQNPAVRWQIDVDDDRTRVSSPLLSPDF